MKVRRSQRVDTDYPAFLWIITGNVSVCWRLCRDSAAAAAPESALLRHVKLTEQIRAQVEAAD